MQAADVMEQPHLLVAAALLLVLAAAALVAVLVPEATVAQVTLEVPVGEWVDAGALGGS